MCGCGFLHIFFHHFGAVHRIGFFFYFYFFILFLYTIVYIATIFIFKLYLSFFISSPSTSPPTYIFLSVLHFSHFDISKFYDFIVYFYIIFKAMHVMVFLFVLLIFFKAQVKQLYMYICMYTARWWWWWGLLGWGV